MADTGAEKISKRFVYLSSSASLLLIWKHLFTVSKQW